jgi:hypothetical protein
MNCFNGIGGWGGLVIDILLSVRFSIKTYGLESNVSCKPIYAGNVGILV